MKYDLKVIKNLAQYTNYCNLHEKLLIENNSAHQDTLELLELLIEDYDRKQQNNSKTKPVELLRELILEGWKSQRDFADTIQLSPQLINDILHYRRRISSKTAQKLATFFALKIDAFSEPYELVKEKLLKQV